MSLETSFQLNDVLKTASMKLGKPVRSKVRRLPKIAPSKAADELSENDKTEIKGLLQKGEVLEQLGNHEMALVYYHRGLKRYPRAQEFKDAINKAEKTSSKKGRRMKLTYTGDITYFTPSHKLTPKKQFTWKQKPAETGSQSVVPSANFRSRVAHGPLTRIHREPSVHLLESRATGASMNSLLADSLEALNYENKLIAETSEKQILGKMYHDKEYLEHILGTEHMKYKKSPLGAGAVSNVAETGLQFLNERTQFWDSLGPLPPPHPHRRLAAGSRNRSQLSIYTSTESLNSVGSYNTASSMKSYRSNTSKTSKGTSKSTYRSRYAFGRKEKPKPPNPEKIKFDFASLRKEELIREMTMIAEEGDPKKESESNEQRARNEDLKRGEEVMAFVEKELENIDYFYEKGQLDVCQQRSGDCIDVLGRYTEESVPNMHVLLSTLYSVLGNCDMQTQNYTSALDNHGQDLMIGEQCNNKDIQSRALGNLGRTYVLMGEYNRAVDMYNRKAPLCKVPKETAWLFHEIGNCFLMMKIYEYAHDAGLKAMRSAHESGHVRLQLQTCVLVAVAEVNLLRYREAYQHFEEALERAKVLDDKKAQDAMTRALVDVNKKMVTQMKKKAHVKAMSKSPVHFDVPEITSATRTTPRSAVSDVTVEG
ncbi:outer dynein arm-docking complex subunit 4-like isoform X2 [Mya arenaria]|uniref:outer dynein arm-docking complex subunit 4-like isoform X2 n=1 Tax=Mya arenaria TaxID=6604 RepID=UPI0022E8B6B1|nr:outer dynein arm-docking complex subunit 4-like isoform X2 [Mya arenaria]